MWIALSVFPSVLIGSGLLFFSRLAYHFTNPGVTNLAVMRWKSLPKRLEGNSQILFQNLETNYTLKCVCVQERDAELCNRAGCLGSGQRQILSYGSCSSPKGTASIIVAGREAKDLFSLVSF